MKIGHWLLPRGSYSSVTCTSLGPNALFHNTLSPHEAKNCWCFKGLQCAQSNLRDYPISSVPVSTPTRYTGVGSLCTSHHPSSYEVDKYHRRYLSRSCWIRLRRQHMRVLHNHDNQRWWVLGNVARVVSFLSTLSCSVVESAVISFGTSVISNALQSAISSPISAGG